MLFEDIDDLTAADIGLYYNGVFCHTPKYGWFNISSLGKVGRHYLYVFDLEERKSTLEEVTSLTPLARYYNYYGTYLGKEWECCGFLKRLGKRTASKGTTRENSKLVLPYEQIYTSDFVGSDFFRAIQRYGNLHCRMLNNVQNESLKDVSDYLWQKQRAVCKTINMEWALAKSILSPLPFSLHYKGTHVAELSRDLVAHTVHPMWDEEISDTFHIRCEDGSKIL